MSADCPPFIVSPYLLAIETGSYAESSETFGLWRAMGRAAGLREIGLNLVELRPGERLSYPHSESEEEEFVFVLDGSCCAWIDGRVFEAHQHDLFGFPSGTGIAHSFFNRGSKSCWLLSGGERDKHTNRTTYADKARSLLFESNSFTSNIPAFVQTARDRTLEESKYPWSPETFGRGAPIGKRSGLQKLGLHFEELRPGERLSYPHAESDEEEFVLVLEGQCDAWIDGYLHRINRHELVGFPSGTGICHTFINNGDESCFLLAGGQASIDDNCTYYPHNPERREQMRKRMGSITNSRGQDWMWDDHPVREMGPHAGLPNPR